MTTYHRDMTADAGPGPARRADLDLVALRLLAGVAQTGSVGGAARLLGMAQPNASRTLARFEAHLRLPLLERSPRGSRLTEHGRLVAEWGAAVLADVDHLLAGIESLRADAAATLRVGASLTVGEHLAPLWLGRFRVGHPDVRVTLHVANSADVIAAVRDGGLDVGFIETPDVPGDLASLVVARDDLVLVVAPEHRWARRRRPIALTELAATPLVAREPGSGTRRAVEELLADLPRAAPLMELSSTGAILAAVAAGTGAAVVSSLAADAPHRAGRVAVVPLDGPSLRRDLRAIWRGPRLQGPAGDFVHQARRDPLTSPRRRT